MSRFCCWNVSHEKSPPILPDLRTTNPLHLEEVPSTQLELQAVEEFLITTLISIHYGMEDIKYKIGTSLQQGATDQVRALIAKKGILLEKKRLFLARLGKVQEALRSFH